MISQVNVRGSARQHVTCMWLGTCKASLNAPKRIEIVTAKQMTKHKHKDRSQFTSLLEPLDNSGDKSQQHQDLQHSTTQHMQICTVQGGGRGRRIIRSLVQWCHLSKDSKQEQPDGSGHARHTRGTQGEGNDTIVLGKHIHRW